MKMKKIIKYFSLLVLLTTSTQGFAVGFGVTLSQANELWKYNNGISGDNRDHEVSSYGFILDTAVARDKVFSYRFSYLNEKNESTDGRDRFTGASTTHDLVFSLYRNNQLRFWMGPRIKIALYDGITVESQNTIGDVTGILWGPVIGLSLHVTKTISLSFSFARLRGYYESEGIPCGFVATCEVDVDTDSNVFSVSLLFRVGGDQY